eukprot:TRINITY_DN8120_c0_g1_i1.p1 TRINITY_DN8120_c0_g1~~TRINITY_DN8120_c0_g1_i1.p1  ORF type:complete len:136 (-),score=31.44 TRINITY_DN8120_c0_g1_i1:228-635(-)
MGSTYSVPSQIVLSYSPDTETQVRAIYFALQKEGYEVHLAPNNGEEDTEETQAALFNCVMLAPCLTPSYQDIGSQHASVAWQLNKPIVPLKFVADYEPEVGDTDLIDFSDPKQFVEAFQHLTDKINSLFFKSYFI